MPLKLDAERAKTLDLKEVRLISLLIHGDAIG